MVTITLPSNLERAVAEEAARKGTHCGTIDARCSAGAILDEPSEAGAPNRSPRRFGINLNRF